MMEAKNRRFHSKPRSGRDSCQITAIRKLLRARSQLVGSWISACRGQQIGHHVEISWARRSKPFGVGKETTTRKRSTRPERLSVFMRRLVRWPGIGREEGAASDGRTSGTNATQTANARPATTKRAKLTLTGRDRCFYCREWSSSRVSPV